MTRWSTLLLDEASLGDMHLLPLPAVAGHAEATIAARPTYQSLYRSWDRQHWSAEALDLQRDADQWERLPARTRDRMRRFILQFLVGEYTGLDLLAPIALCAPDEHALIYLGTQIGDESRHTRLMDRLAGEVARIGDDDLRVALDVSWKDSTPAQRALSSLESRLTKDLAAGSATYDDWLRTVAVFHIVTEGVLALTAQRQMVRALATGTLFPGLRAGFTAMTRDESRHVSFGMAALRRGVIEHGTPQRVEAVADAVREGLRAALAAELPARPTAYDRREALKFGRTLEAEALLRLKALDFPPAVADWIKAGMTEVLDEVAGPSGTTE
jgi:ribonucleotide reductase beta subunit family protein with ferritin-like domain